MSTYPSRVAAWQEECELHGTAQVCHICPFLPLSAELEVTENFGDFWVSFFTYATCSAAWFASFCVMAAARSMTEMRGGTSSVMRSRLIVYPSNAAS